MYTFDLALEFGKLVVVCGKQGFGTELLFIADILHDGPGDREAVIGRGAAPDLIQDQKTL